MLMVMLYSAVIARTVEMNMKKNFKDGQTQIEQENHSEFKRFISYVIYTGDT